MSDPVMSEDEINRQHREKMQRRQAARKKVLATKTEERGLLIVHTGAGKGKSTAAFGMVLRCLGHGMRVGIVQRSEEHTSELQSLRHLVCRLLLEKKNKTCSTT